MNKQQTKDTKLEGYYLSNSSRKEKKMNWKYNIFLPSTRYLAVGPGESSKKGEKTKVTMWESKYDKYLYKFKEMEHIYSKTKWSSNSEHMKISMGRGKMD